MIDVADNDAAYYYHYDGLGSVVALSDSDGDTIQTYEYSVYGQVGAEDPDFLTNPYMFTGRRLDIETGHYQYYGISGNMRSLKRFYVLTLRMTLKWLNRRSQCKSFYWKSFIAYLRHYPLPKPRIVHNLHTLSPVM